MPLARAMPFSFAPLLPEAEAPELPTPAPAVAQQTALAEAFAAGRAAGLAAARENADADAARAANAAADAVLAAASAHRSALAEERQALRAATQAALRRFAERLAAAREAEAALALVDRLIAASSDRSAATLHLGADACCALSGRLANELAARGAADFIKIAPDAALPPGEARLSWRGGEATSRLAATLSSIDAIFTTDASED